MTVTTGLTRDECAKTGTNNPGTCFPYLPNTTGGMTLVYRFPGDRMKSIRYSVSSSPPEVCQIFLDHLDPTIPAACVPVPLAMEECKP